MKSRGIIAAAAIAAILGGCATTGEPPGHWWDVREGRAIGETSPADSLVSLFSARHECRQPDDPVSQRKAERCMNQRGYVWRDDPPELVAAMKQARDAEIVAAWAGGLAAAAATPSAPVSVNLGPHVNQPVMCQSLPAGGGSVSTFCQ